MTVLDWIIVALALAAAVQGLFRGFLVGALTLAGFAAGAFAGSRLAGALAERRGVIAVGAGLRARSARWCWAGVVAGLFEVLGTRARRGMRSRAFAGIDAGLGALLGVGVALAAVWIAGAVALQTPGLGSLRTDVQRSAVLRTLNDALPPSGPVLRALARVDPLPAIRGPSTTAVDRPRAAILTRRGVRLAASGTVRILGDACGLGIEGSGWLVAPGVVVTNAHVVAGTDGDVVVRTRNDVAVPARALAFDPENDLAVLAAPGLPGRVLRVASKAPEGTAAAILGFPRDGPFDARAARIGATQTVLTEDAYGHGPLRRAITAIRGLLRPGNSGGPVVDSRGRVLATVFAASTNSRTPGRLRRPQQRARAAPGDDPAGDSHRVHRTVCAMRRCASAPPGARRGSRPVALRPAA